MSSLVSELQREAFDQSISTSSLLRKAYVLSKKLKVEEFSNWANSELRGYELEENVPKYRIVRGKKRVYDVNYGYIESDFEDGSDGLDFIKIQSPLTSIESLLEQVTDKSSFVRVKYSSAIQTTFKELMGDTLELYLLIPPNRVREILENVRNIILEWTLKLEEEGIVGDGMSFSKVEKEKAEEISITNNIYGNLINSQVQQGTKDLNQDNYINEGFQIEELNVLIDNLLKLSGELDSSEAREELKADIEVIKAQINSPNPKKNIIKETLKSTKNIAEGVTGSLIANSIELEVIKLLTKL